MSVAKWNSIGQNQRVKITTVDPISRKVEATTKDSSIIQIAVWGQPTVFRWPKVGEIWIVARMGGYWMLVEPVQKDVEEAAPLEGFNSGDVNVTTGEGGRFLVNGAHIGIVWPETGQVRIVRGRIAFPGGTQEGTGWSWVRTLGGMASGDYTITFTTSFSGPPSVVLTLGTGHLATLGQNGAEVVSASSSGMRVWVGSSGVGVDPDNNNGGSLTFVAVGPA